MSYTCGFHGMGGCLATHMWVIGGNLYCILVMVLNVFVKFLFIEHKTEYLHVYHCNRKTIFKEMQNFIHLNLAIALSLALVAFVSGIQTATENDVSCN